MKRAHRLSVTQALCTIKWVSLNARSLNKTEYECNRWTHLTILKSNGTNIDSKKLMEIQRSGYCRPVPVQAWLDFLEDVTFCDSKPSSEAGGTPFIYKTTSTFTYSTTMQRTSYKTKVNWKLFQRRFLVFLLFLVFHLLVHPSTSEISPENFPSVLCLDM